MALLACPRQGSAGRDIARPVLQVLPSVLSSLHGCWRLHTERWPDQPGSPLPAVNLLQPWRRDHTVTPLSAQSQKQAPCQCFCSRRQAKQVWFGAAEAEVENESEQTAEIRSSLSASLEQRRKFLHKALGRPGWHSLDSSASLSARALPRAQGRLEAGLQGSVHVSAFLLALATC